MFDNEPILFPAPGGLRLGFPPYRRSTPGVVPIAVTFMLAAGVVILSGTVLFGLSSLRVLAISVAVALLVESVLSAITHRTRLWSESYALLMGMLFACTLPATVSWQVPVVGAALGVLLGQVLPGGVGNYVWHPAVLGRIAVQILFHEQVTPTSSSVLASGHLLWGNLSRVRELPGLCNWGSSGVGQGVEAWLTVRPADHLRMPIPAGAGDSVPEALGTLVRDTLPPWPDTLLGVAGGGIGEACVIAAIIAGLILLWRGFLRWPMFTTALLTAVVLSAILPMRVQFENGMVLRQWFPGFCIYQGLPVGLVYVCYHVTAGEFLLVLLLLAPDPSSSPLTLRGHAWFGFIIGAVTLVLRVVVGLPASAYWALLIANTFVPFINMATRRRVLGTW